MGYEPENWLMIHLNQRIFVELKPVPNFYSGPISIFLQIDTLRYLVLGNGNNRAILGGFLESTQRSSDSQGSCGASLWGSPHTGRPPPPSPSGPALSQVGLLLLGESLPPLCVFPLSETSPFIFLTHRLPVCHHRSHPPPTTHFLKVISKHPLPSTGLNFQ